MSEIQKLICPYCSKTAEFMTTQEYYGKDYGTNIYVCSDCDATVGTHLRSKKPKGTLANKKLRNLRKSCHGLFEPYCKSRGMSRSESYKFLQDIMNMTPEEAHIGNFREEQCFELIEKICKLKGINYKAPTM